jgi:hypothetical protein
MSKGTPQLGLQQGRLLGLNVDSVCLVRFLNLLVRFILWKPGSLNQNRLAHQVDSLAAVFDLEKKVISPSLYPPTTPPGEQKRDEKLYIWRAQRGRRVNVSVVQVCTSIFKHRAK